MISAAASRAVLGVDGLLLGGRAALAVGGRVVAEFVLALGEDRSVPARVRAAFQRAVDHLRDLPAEVRLVAVDDGQDGSGYVEAEVWLTQRGVTFVVLDPAVITLPDPGTDPDMESGRDADADTGRDTEPDADTDTDTDTDTELDTDTGSEPEPDDGRSDPGVTNDSSLRARAAALW